jgi:hypothetical protein
MTLSNHQRMALIARIRRYSIDQLFRLSDLAERERFRLDGEWAMLRMTNAQHERRQYVVAVYALIGQELDRRLAAPIERTAA